MQTNILEYLERTVLRLPDKVAFCNEETGLTFQQVYDQSRAIGTFLSREGFYKQPVVVFMKSSKTAGNPFTITTLKLVTTVKTKPIFPI